jgi:hypothetical protein
LAVLYHAVEKSAFLDSSVIIISNGDMLGWGKVQDMKFPELEVEGFGLVGCYTA